MEIRCENCHKLFRVPDEIITEKGNKFICTRCGEYVVAKRKDINRKPPLPGDNVIGLNKAEPEQDPSAIQLTQEEEQIPLFTDFVATFKPVPETENATPNKPEKIQTIEPAPLEIRCDSCKKLFHVPGHKICGSGIKFLCTRCGEYVTIDSHVCDQYILSKNAQSAEDKPGPAPAVQSLDKTTLPNPEEQSNRNSVTEMTVPTLTQPQPTHILPVEDKAEYLSESLPEPIHMVSPDLQKEPLQEPLPEHIEIPNIEPKIEHIPDFYSGTKVDKKIEEINLSPARSRTDILTGGGNSGEGGNPGGE